MVPYLIYTIGKAIKLLFIFRTGLPWDQFLSHFYFLFTWYHKN